MNKVFLLTVLLVFPNMAFSWDFSDCQINQVILGGDDRNAHVELSCYISNVPACAVANKYFGFDRSTDSGKQKLALVMTAHASSMKVTGTINQTENSCPSWQNNVALLSHLRVTK